MSYSRPVLAGIALKQSPTATTPAQTGVRQLTLNSEIATASSLGVVQVGAGINVDANGVISTDDSGSGFVHVTLTSVDYTALPNDYYIGVTSKSTTVTLPLGNIGKTYIIKNQSGGNIKVVGTNGQTLDSSNFKSLGGENAIIVIFDGTRWNLI